MSCPDSRVIVEAPAKINLTLEVLRRRPDGYHDLRSLVMPVALTDRIELTFAGQGVETVVTAEPGIDLRDLGAPEENLATRAARLLQARAGVSGGVRIRIHKRIPIGGGLGGGSADAAGTLIGLNKLWNLKLPLEALLEAGIALGSDIPALLLGGAVCMEGRGERVRPLFTTGERPVPAMAVVIANPGLSSSTAEVFRNCLCSRDLTERPDILHTITPLVRNGDAPGTAASLFNGLQPVVFARHPAIEALAARLRATGALGVLVSGSGASVFALVRDREHGEAVRRQLNGGVWSVLTTTLPDGVMVAHGPLEP